MDSCGRESVLDLVLTLGLTRRLFLRVLSDAITDHHPVSVLWPTQKSPTILKVLYRRDFKRFSKSDLFTHINAEALSEIFMEEDKDKVAGTIVGYLTKVLDVLAPLKWILVKDSTTLLYLQKETRSLMAERDLAALRIDWLLFWCFEKKAARRGRQDILHSNLNLLSRCKGNPKQVW